jgi:hypothetical protein
MASPKKSGLALVLAMGKPKSRNQEGQTSESISAPDQGEGMPPGGEMMEDEMVETSEPDGDEGYEKDNCIALPPGFQPPDGVEMGQTFDTTVRGKITDKGFEVESIGDMSVKPEMEAEEEAEEIEPEISDEGKSIMKRRGEEKAARDVFQKGF